MKLAKKFYFYKIFSSHMVLQRHRPIIFYGCADAGAAVTLTLAGESKTVATNADGVWRVELIKHDFSTFDIFGAWGFEMRNFPATGDWTFAKQDKTSAEIIIDLYRAILAGAGDAMILGCNTIGHLGAGVMHLARTGDDTSGRNWERTRKMGINTLALRLAQHRAFFDADPDCVGIPGAIDWRLNEAWARLIAISGASFFASIQPGVLTAEQKVQMKKYFAVAANGRCNAELLDWLTTNCPQLWRIDGAETAFYWYGADGVAPECIQ